MSLTNLLLLAILGAILGGASGAAGMVLLGISLPVVALVLLALIEGASARSKSRRPPPAAPRPTSGSYQSIGPADPGRQRPQPVPRPAQGPVANVLTWAVEIISWSIILVLGAAAVVGLVMGFLGS